MLQIQTGNSLSEAYFRLSVGLHRFLKVILKAMRKAKKKKNCFLFHPCFRLWSTDDNPYKQLSYPWQIKLASYLNIPLLLVKTYFEP